MFATFFPLTKTGNFLSFFSLFFTAVTSLSGLDALCRRRALVLPPEEPPSPLFRSVVHIYVCFNLFHLLEFWDPNGPIPPHHQVRYTAMNNLESRACKHGNLAHNWHPGPCSEKATNTKFLQGKRQTVNSMDGPLPLSISSIGLGAWASRFRNLFPRRGLRSLLCLLLSEKNSGQCRSWNCRLRTFMWHRWVPVSLLWIHAYSKKKPNSASFCIIRIRSIFNSCPHLECFLPAHVNRCVEEKPLPSQAGLFSTGIVRASRNFYFFLLAVKWLPSIMGFPTQTFQHFKRNLLVSEVDAKCKIFIGWDLLFVWDVVGANSRKPFDN